MEGEKKSDRPIEERYENDFKPFLGRFLFSETTATTVACARLHFSKGIHQRYPSL